MEVEIKRLPRGAVSSPRRHLDQDRVRCYAEVLDQLPPGDPPEDHALLLTDGYHWVAAAQHAEMNGELTEISTAGAHPWYTERPMPSCCSTPEVVAKLRRHTGALEKDESFRIQIAGARIRVGVRDGQADHDAGGDKHAQHRPAGVL
jgi:hypothetical protein